MSAGSIAVVVLLFALVGLALWRNFRKGAPCACGRSCKDCCCCDGDTGRSAPPVSSASAEPLRL